MHKYAICLFIILTLIMFNKCLFAGEFSESFENGSKDWQFSNGGEYKGATGNLSINSTSPHVGEKSLELSADFSGGGRYVAAFRKFDPPLITESISFWVKTQDVTKILMRFYDQTDQCFQHELIVPRGTEWKQITVDKLAGRVKWGGAKDGRWHGQLTKIGVLIEKQKIVGDSNKASVLIDDISIPAKGNDGASDNNTAISINLGHFDDCLDSWWVHSNCPREKEISLSRESEGKTGKALVIQADFSKGGNWFNAIRQIDQPVDISSLSFWIKPVNVNKVNISITSQSGQNITFTETVDPAKGWQKVSLSGFKPGDNPEAAKKFQLYGSRMRINLSLDPSCLIDPGNTVGTLFLDDVEGVFSARGNYTIVTTGTQAMVANGVAVKFESLRALPFYWGRGDRPTGADFTVKNTTDKVVKAPAVNLLDHGLRTISTLYAGGDELKPGESLKKRLIPGLHEFGLYYFMSEINGRQLTSRYAWLAAEAVVDKESPFGIQTHLGQGPWGKSQTLDGGAGALELIRKMGAGWIRDDGRLKIDGDGHYSFWHKAAGMGFGLIMNFVDFNDANRPPRSASALDKYARDLSTIIQKNFSDVQHYEIWNEPNIAPGWRGTPNSLEYVRILQKAYTEAKKAKPSATIIGVTSCGTDFDYIAKVVKAGGANYMDAVSAHPYHGVAPELAKKGDKPNPQWMGEGDSVTFRKRMEAIHNIFVQAGKPDMTIYATEMGGDPAKHVREYTTGDFVHWENMFARWMVRQFMIGMSIPYLKLQVVYNLQDQGYDAEPDYHMTFGMIRSDGEPEPRYVAYNTMSRMLSRHRYSQTIKLSGSVYCYEFINKDNGQKTYALWTVDRGVTVSLQVSGPFTVVDLMGNSRTVNPIDGIVNIGVSGSPVFIKGLSRVIESKQSVFKLDNLPDKSFTSMDTIRLSFTASKVLQGDIKCSLPKGWHSTVKGGSIAIIPARNSPSGTYEIIAQKGGMSSAISILLNNSISVSNLPLVQEGVELTFSNPFSEKQIVAVSTSADKSRKPDFEIALDAAARKTHLLKIQPLTDEGYLTVPLKLRMEVKTAPGMVLQYSADARENLVAGFTPCFGVSDTEIDGNIDAWGKHPPLLLKKGFQAKGIGKKKYDWKGPSDLSAKVYAGYDKKYFYLAAEVTDDQHIQPYSAEDAWKGDSVQFAFYLNNVRYEFTLSSKGGGSIFQSSPEKGNVAGASVSVNTNKMTTVYEARIPWALLGGKAKPEMRFAMLVNDCDTQNGGGLDSRRGYLEWFEGIGGSEGKQPQLYSVLKYVQ